MGFRAARLALCAAAISLCLGSLPTTARADGRFFTVWGSGLVGGVTGRGDGGVDFFDWASGGAGGFEIGARILFIGAYVNYLNFFGKDASLWSFNMGGDTAWNFNQQWALVFRLAGSVYFGSIGDNETRMVDGQRISGNQVNTRGIGFKAGLGPRYTFAKFFSVGITPQIGYHLFFSGADEGVIATDNDSSGWDFEGLAYLRMAFGI